MKDEGLTQLEVFEADPEKVAGYRWCKAVDELEEDAYCGQMCKDYIPRNGRGGNCKFNGQLYMPGEKVTLTIPKSKNR